MTTGTERRHTVLVVVNSPTSGLRRLGPWLTEEGVTPVACLGPVGLPPTLGDHDGLVMLGGGMMPDDDSAAPWLAGERALTRRAIDEGVPILGICLGGQILAHVSGGTVEASSGTPERGATDIVPTPAGRADPLTAPLGEVTPMIENHRDRITALGPDSTLLASSAACRIQAFRVGASAYGVQFHPEVSPEDLLGWDESALADQGLDLHALVAHARRLGARNARAARGLARAFARMVTAR